METLPDVRHLPEAQRDALALMQALVLENGKCWGECAAPFQHEDAVAIFAPSRPNYHFLTRPRGGSKSTDIAAVALAWLVMEAPPRSRGYVVASNAEQAAEVIDAAASLVMRTPELEDVLVVEAERIIAPNEAWIRVLSMSDSGAWGKRDAHILICDEFAQWPETRAAKRVWTAIRTTVQKTPGCRLVILTSAGEPSHWSYTQVFQAALSDPKNWRVHEVPGPVPWHSPDDLEALERELLPSEYDRLVLNIWSESEDRAVTPEDYEVAATMSVRPFGVAPPGIRGGGTRLLFPRDGVRYIVTVDVGTRNDATVICVAHKEASEDGPARVVVDHLERWQGSKKHHVTVDSVEQRVLSLAVEYERARVYADPDQFVGSVQRLNRQGVRAEEWRFSATSVGQVATALVQCFRNRAVVVPHSDALREELLRVRLRESAPGVTRLDHARAGHDDQAVAIGMACHILMDEHKGFSSAKAFLAAAQEAGSRAKSRADERRESVAARSELRRIMGRNRRVGRPACSHRWRGDRCVFCGETQELVS